MPTEPAEWQPQRSGTSHEDPSFSLSLSLATPHSPSLSPLSLPTRSEMMLDSFLKFESEPQNYADMDRQGFQKVVEALNRKCQAFLVMLLGGRCVPTPYPLSAIMICNSMVASSSSLAVLFLAALAGVQSFVLQPYGIASAAATRCGATSFVLRHKSPANALTGVGVHAAHSACSRFVMVCSLSCLFDCSTFSVVSRISDISRPFTFCAHLLNEFEFARTSHD